MNTWHTAAPVTDGNGYPYADDTLHLTWTDDVRTLTVQVGTTVERDADADRAADAVATVTLDGAQARDLYAALGRILADAGVIV